MKTLWRYDEKRLNFKYKLESIYLNCHEIVIIECQNFNKDVYCENHW